MINQKKNKKYESKPMNLHVSPLTCRCGCDHGCVHNGMLDASTMDDHG